MGRIPELDGLRGLAILLVVVSHAELGIFDHGGVVGVTLFFVLSGYLITRLLVAQIDGGGLTFRRFYARRARRLFPALIVMVIGAALIHPDNWWDHSWPALLYGR